jgi:hypothetical protein
MVKLTVLQRVRGRTGVRMRGCADARGDLQSCCGAKQKRNVSTVDLRVIESIRPRVRVVCVWGPHR